jgi:hypothetical protein
MEDFVLLYSEELDAWIIQTEDEPDENGNLAGRVLFVGENRDLEEQQDELLDLILKDDEDKGYYEEILRIISN